MGVGETLVVGVVAGLLVAAIWHFTKPHLQARTEAREEERLLRAFLEMATEANPHEKLTVAISSSEAADRASIRDLDPVLDRLVRKDHIRPDQTFRNHYNLTFEGRQRAENNNHS